MELAINSFLSGILLDTHPLQLSNTSLSNALNSTFITMNGNEAILQNDMGNARVQNANLPEGYVPVGIKEYGGIIYVASYNPLTGNSQLGSFPSPQRINGNWKTANKGAEIYYINEFINKDNNTINKKFILSLIDDSKLHSGDKFSLYFSDFNDRDDNVEFFRKWIYKSSEEYDNLFTLQVGVLNSQNEFVDITNTLKSFDFTVGGTEYNYFILNIGVDTTENSVDKVRSLEAVNTYNNKIVGSLYLKQILNYPDNINYQTVINKNNSGKYEILVTVTFDATIDPLYLGCEFFGEVPSGIERDKYTLKKTLQISEDSKHIENNILTLNIKPYIVVNNTYYYIEDFNREFDITKVNSGKVEIVEYRFYNESDYSLLYLNIESYPKTNESYTDLRLRFNKEKVYTPVLDSNSIDGIFRFIIDWQEVGLQKRKLYEVEILYNDGNEDRTVDGRYWLLTTSLLNNCYDSNNKDFVKNYCIEGEKTIARYCTIPVGIKWVDEAVNIYDPEIEIYNFLEPTEKASSKFWKSKTTYKKDFKGHAEVDMDNALFPDDLKFTIGIGNFDYSITNPEEIINYADISEYDGELPIEESILTLNTQLKFNSKYRNGKLEVEGITQSYILYSILEITNAVKYTPFIEDFASFSGDLIYIKSRSIAISPAAAHNTTGVVYSKCPDLKGLPMSYLHWYYGMGKFNDDLSAKAKVEKGEEDFGVEVRVHKEHSIEGHNDYECIMYLNEKGFKERKKGSNTFLYSDIINSITTDTELEYYSSDGYRSSIFCGFFGHEDDNSHSILTPAIWVKTDSDEWILIDHNYTIGVIMESMFPYYILSTSPDLSNVIRVSSYLSICLAYCFNNILLPLKKCYRPTTELLDKKVYGPNPNEYIKTQDYTYKYPTSVEAKYNGTVTIDNTFNLFSVNNNLQFVPICTKYLEVESLSYQNETMTSGDGFVGMISMQDKNYLTFNSEGIYYIDEGEAKLYPNIKWKGNYPVYIPTGTKQATFIKKNGGHSTTSTLELNSPIITLT